MSYHNFFNTHLALGVDLQIRSLKCFSSVKTETRPSQVTVHSADYLVRSLNLSPESALSIATQKRIELKSTARADEVIALFKQYGFTETHMAKIFSSYPSLLSSNAHKTLKPKLDFLTTNSISGEALLHIISDDPSILKRSLTTTIIPCFNFLKSFTGDAQRVASVFTAKRGTRVLRHFSESLTSNVEALQGFGVPDSHILKMIMNIEYGFLARDTAEFSEAVNEVKEMGIDPSTKMFIHGVCALSGMSKDKRVLKREVFRSFGWTDEEVNQLFVKQPKVMALSERGLKEKLEFFMKGLEMSASDIAKYPSIMCSSFGNRLSPRRPVLETLISKGLVKKTIMAWGFNMTEDLFLTKFVVKFQHDLPELLEMYLENMGPES